MFQMGKRYLLRSPVGRLTHADLSGRLIKTTRPTKGPSSAAVLPEASPTSIAI